MLPAPIGYCTNVHAGADLAQTRANLERYALTVKRLACPGSPMGLGLWLSASAAHTLLQSGVQEEWRSWLSEVGLIPFTFNGFPYGDFHGRVVKHQVYHPNWSDPGRLNYTQELIAIMDAFLPPGLEGSLSTLPIAWGTPTPRKVDLEAAGKALREVAKTLGQLEKERGRVLSLCLEPEPGCYLQRGLDVVRFFEEYLLGGSDEDLVRRHIRVCHDVCHAVVMFESQAEVLGRYRSAGIGVGKVQVSSAVVLSLTELDPRECAAALDQLTEFHEDRYLHQTVCQPRDGGPVVFHEDLAPALESARQALPAELRVHFHVPIYLERFGHLRASRDAILECLAEIRKHEDTNHLEVETYAWGVLPLELQVPDLAEGIAREVTWLSNVMNTRT